MDQINFGTLLGYYSVECGNTFGLGGAFFAALCGAGILAKEEKDRTAEFLLTHPISRSKVVTQKLLAVFVQITILSVVVYTVSILSMSAVGETVPWKEVNLLHLANFLLQIELAGICFGVSAFLKRGSMGIGLGVAIMMYFLNLISNITESAEFLKYLTPFAYTDGASIVTNVELDVKLITIGMVYAVVGIGIAYWKYIKKDIV
jgi:ABC-2 type transport system permease protein